MENVNHFYLICYRTQRAFTLVELMIVIAIIGILAALSIPAYQEYIRYSAERACLYEAKAYANYTFVTIQDRENGAVLKPPALFRCEAVDSAVGWSDLDHIIIATPNKPGVRKVSCDLKKGASCGFSSPASN